MKRNLMNELKEGMDALKEKRNMERDRLDERLGKNRERVDQEELFAPNMDEEQYMKFNREHLEELTRQKIKEVNDEAGYRSYLEVPEMVNIIASIMEDKFRVEYDDLVNQIHLLSKELDKHNARVHKLSLEEWRTFDQS